MNKRFFMLFNVVTIPKELFIGIFLNKKYLSIFWGPKKRDKVLYTLTDKELKRKTEQREIETEIEMNHYSF
jgi:hypothetical protein